MGKRSRLFASAAFPLLSLSLAFEPAAAAALREQPVAPLTNDIVGVVAGGANASIEVAQQAAPAAQPDEEQLKHKKPAEGGQGEPQGQKHEGGAEQKPPKQQPVGAERPRLPTNGSLRNVIDALFLTAEDLEGFVVDNFPELLRHFGPAMGHIARVNVLLQILDKAVLLKALAGCQDFGRHQHLLKFDS